ncbi:MAG: 50S ribosomal protein L11 methyltransferase [Bdellovibrionaceae bacterium]|nr:50S ribosomal protein L11 methyltransferase [Pseudobdellovibrionaceae bacterium]|tara:strand:+ start:4908 stop:5888 length:981 start_codon:yes stop_codon:yes gene_type:complete
MNQATYRFSVSFKESSQIIYMDQGLSLEQLLGLFWEHWKEQGLVGIHEGTVLSEEAFDLGVEKQAWILDSGETPVNRDWVASKNEAGKATVTLYFSSQEAACAAQEWLSFALQNKEVRAIEEVIPEDWNAEWKKSFKRFSLGKNWEVVPSWEKKKDSNKRTLRILPGAGFGTGTHETTQLCLELMENLSWKGSPSVLDFGSGSGILSIAAALLGASSVLGVEIDSLAVDNAKENAELNGVESKVQFISSLEDQSYDLVIANILRPVLIEFSDALIQRLRPGGRIILSGLIESDVKEIQSRYSALGVTWEAVSQKNEWWGLLGLLKA